MSAEQVALIPQCAECGEVWLPADEERRQARHDRREPTVADLSPAIALSKILRT